MALTINYTPTVTGGKFMNSDARMRVIMGPVGCVSGDTLVITEFGPLPIERIDRPMRVLSWNDQTGRYQLSWCGGAFPKGKDYLHQVVTPHGEFAAAGHHQLLDADRNYQPVGSLVPGQSLHLYSGSLPLSTPGADQSWSERDVLRSTRTALSFLDYYAGLARRYGQRLLQGEDSAQEFVPAPDDAQTLQMLSDLLVSFQTDAPPEQLLLHTHQDQFFYQIETGGSAPRVVTPHGDAADQDGALPFGHNAETTPQFLQSLPTSDDHLTALRFSGCSGSYITSCSNGTILSVTREDVKRIYWDMQVLDTGNYVTVDGTVHHNSGKSVLCCFELIRRASQQKPNPQGVRKSRAIVVRETARQLQDTTIKTFLDWFPSGVCGEYRRTTKTFFFKVADVECEIMFRALDDADDVANLNSLEATFAWVNESRDIDPAILDALSKRVGRFPSKKDGGPTWHGIFMDTNPPVMDTYHYYMMEHVDPKDGVTSYDNGWEVFKQPSGRSPYAENTENLPDDYYETKGKSEEYIRVFIDGEYGLSSAGRPVFKYFRPDIHIAQQPLKPYLGSARPVVVGLDCGLTPAAVFGQMDPMGRALVYDEAVSFDMGMQRFLRQVVKPKLYERFSGARVLIVVDPAGMQRAQTDERSVVDIIKAEGLKVIPARTNSVVARINSVDEFLMRQVDGMPGILLDQRCMKLKAALMGGYRYQTKGEAVDKNDHSHVADALQYFCLHINSSLSGDLVSKSRPVTNVSSVGWT